MAEDLVVEILEGKHSRPAPNGTRETFENLMRNAGFTKGFFKVLLGRQIRGASEAKKIMIHNLDEQTGTIMIKAQIDGRKDQRFETFLTLPNNFRQKPEIFLTALKRGEELINNPPAVENPASEILEDHPKILKNQTSEKSEDKKPERSSKGIGFDHFIADDDSIYLFWLDIKKFFQNDEKMTTRKELTENFLVEYGHFASCYRFISKLVRLGIFAEIKAKKGNRKDLVIGEKLLEIIAKTERGDVEKEQFSEKSSFSGYLEKISKLESTVKEKKNVEDLLEQRKERIRSLEEERKALNLEIEDLKKQFTPEMQEAEEKLEALHKILG